ncbi:MAG: isoleucine--tRNA ligase [Oscillospiraceae bacterium]|jgi:isoleucyl-tRNA synthetase|nr:isoleucine--tRNA ligase [Oscillospiraceae bacterium]
MDYKNTIITPKTDFPMRAGLPAREPGMLEHWNKIDVYALLMKKNEGKPRFILHDGPPFSNGSMHMGHALNKTLKDIIVRSYAMRGYHTPFTPGWDNHGMPIESAIIKKNKLNHKAMPVAEFRSACAEFAQNFVDIQMDGMKRMGIIGDWAQPYRTMDKRFEAEEVRVFGEMYRKGYIYKGLKPVYWCPKDETALAEAEIEYQDDPCTSIYVKFALKDDKGKLAQFGTEKTYFVIWTTTTWTLPGNLAIALNPRESYALVQAENGERYVLAQALAEKTLQAAGITEYETLATFEGSFFEYMTAQHPFLDRDSLLVVADYVTMETGTGCVHTAPGFGADDYQTCRRYNMDMVVPVDDRGFQTADAGKFAGLHYAKSNDAIFEDLQESGALFASERFTHSYPHCWRCKSPIIFRATPQWFCSVEAFKDEAIAACDEVKWLPAWGKDRMVAMIRDRADWCISRQRRWGLPIPVFYCKDCGKPVCTPESIAHVSALFAEHGSNIWFESDNLVPDGFGCPHCGGKDFTKELDTLDGWFDSGSTHIASLALDNPAHWPADVYLEGADQYRGWFQSSLLTSVGALGKGAPFKQCLTHGWTVDGEGKAMHKSLGNGVDPADMIRDFGADIVRLWAGSTDYRADVRCSKEIFKQLSQSYLKFRNTARYCLGNLDGFDANRLVLPGEMLELDRWAITRLNKLMETGAKAYDNFEFHVLTHAINDFCVVELSSFYFDILKDRLYCDAPDGIARRSAQTALFLIVDAMAKLFAPILPFTCDEIWQTMPHRAGDDAQNIILNDMANPYADYALDADAMAKWDALIALRAEVNGVLETARAQKVIGKALEAQVTLYAKEDAGCAILAAVKDKNLAELLIVSQATIAESAPNAENICGGDGAIAIEVSPANGEKCPRCWMHTTSPDGQGLCPRCAAVMRELDSTPDES